MEAKNNKDGIDNLNREMTPHEFHEDLKKKVLEGLKLAYQNMVKFKKEKNSVIVVMREGKIVHLKP